MSQCHSVRIFASLSSLSLFIAIVSSLPLPQSTFMLHDLNGDGSLSKAEFSRFWILQPSRTNDEKGDYYGKIYEDYDTNFDLKLDETELRKMLAIRFHLKGKHSALNAFDLNGDQGLNVFEFINFERNFPFQSLKAIEKIEADLIDEIEAIDAEINHDLKEVEQLKQLPTKVPLKKVKMVKKHEKLPMSKPRARSAKSQREVVSRLIPLPNDPEELRPMLRGSHRPLITVF
ncbi:unnamed protein product, partial [Mesorhabditis belari]|uniref:EF-hand domain-containing protein n=1 Tax=Mesorhabditis belari TaxID=2138241 RepID=A0AAF3EF51_9BILA